MSLYAPRERLDLRLRSSHKSPGSQTFCMVPLHSMAVAYEGQFVRVSVCVSVWTLGPIVFISMDETHAWQGHWHVKNPNGVNRALFSQGKNATHYEQAEEPYENLNSARFAKTDESKAFQWRKCAESGSSLLVVCKMVQCGTCVPQRMNLKEGTHFQSTFPDEIKRKRANKSYTYI